MSKRLAVFLLVTVAACITGAGATPAAGAPFILQLELAWSLEHMRALLAEFHMSDAQVRNALAWDYGFLVAYSLQLALIGTWWAGRWPRAGRAAAMAAVAAAACDA